jgi:phosphoglycerate kinase
VQQQHYHHYHRLSRLYRNVTGLQVGSSLVEDDKMELAKSLEAMAKAKGCELLLPSDVVVADKFDPNANSQTVPITAIPDGWMGLDIGPDSIKLFESAWELFEHVAGMGACHVYLSMSCCLGLRGAVQACGGVGAR